jgi:hypothetical protein
VRANRAFRLLHARHPDADQVEVVEIATNEIVLFWDVRRADARRFVSALKADLAGLEEDEFLARWNAVDGPADLV